MSAERMMVNAMQEQPMLLLPVLVTNIASKPTAVLFWALPLVGA